MKSAVRHLEVAVVTSMVLLAGCASNNGYLKGLSDSSAAKGSSRTIAATPDSSIQAAKLTLISKGFAIDSIDTQNGLIKSSRNLPDESDKDMSYHINAIVDTTPKGKAESVVTLSANQQTIMHRVDRTWWKLLFIIPLFPVKTEYQTIVLKEGDIKDATFYNDFFVALDKNLATVATAEKPVKAPEATPEVKVYPLDPAPAPAPVAAQPGSVDKEVSTATPSG